MIKELSVFFPAYNEEKNISKTVKDTVKVLEDKGIKYEALVIDDGSKDKTAEIVKKLHKENEKVKLVSHNENKGYGAAIKTGMKNSQYEWVCFTDSDGQFDFKQIKRFLKHTDENDLIIGYREKRSDSLVRRFIANVLLRIWNLILYGVWFKDVDCGFKLFKKQVVDKVYPKLVTESAITETEFMVRSKRNGFKINEVPVTHHARTGGDQTGGNFKVVSKAVLQGIKLYLSFLKEFFSQWQNILFFIILVLGAFLRFFKLRAYMTFLGDQGRDALVVWKMLKEGDITFLGPVASMGGFYLGPIYYYFMVPFLFLWNYNPVGPAVMVVLFDLATIVLIYKFCNEFINKKVALLSTFLYAISNLVIVYSRFSWNPNILPFFSFLVFYSYAKAIIKKQKFFYLIAGLSTGVIVQLHYMAVLMFPFMILAYFLLDNKKEIKDIFQLIGGFLITFSPFLLFEIRHGFPNFNTIFNFVLKGEEVGLLTGGKQVVNNTFISLGTQLFSGILTPGYKLLGKILLIFSLIGIFFEYLTPRIMKRKQTMLLFFLISLIFISSIYNNPIHDHYLTFLFFLPPLIFSIAFFKFVDNRKLLFIPGAILIFLLVRANFQENLLHGEPNRQLAQLNRVTNIIIDKAQNNKFNFAMATPGNSDHAYRYFLTKKGYEPVKIENRIEEELMVVCEVQDCNPIDKSLWEIREFGDAKIEGKWSDDEVIFVYRLVHTKKSEDLIGQPAKK